MNRGKSDVVFTHRGCGFGVWPGIGRLMLSVMIQARQRIAPMAATSQAGL
jgi:hypothetical protein